MDVKERGDVLQVEVIHNAGTALHQQVVAFAGCGTMEVDVARLELVKNMLGNDGTQLHRLLALLEELLQLLACDPDNAAGHHRHDGGMRRTAIEVRRVVGYEFALERKPCDMFPVVADAMCHVLKATALYEGEPTCRVALTLQLVTLVVDDRLTLPLATLGYAALLAKNSRSVSMSKLLLLNFCSIMC